MQTRSLNLATNVTSTTAAQNWMGGRTALVLTASAYGSTVQLQVQNQDGNWASINSSSYSGNQCVSYDLPAGQYRMNITGGTTTALYATLVTIPYG